MLSEGERDGGLDRVVIDVRPKCGTPAPHNRFGLLERVGRIIWGREHERQEQGHRGCFARVADSSEFARHGVEGVMVGSHGGLSTGSRPGCLKTHSYPGIRANP